MLKRNFELVTKLLWFYFVPISSNKLAIGFQNR
jgi:hypothetical protein